MRVLSGVECEMSRWEKTEKLITSVLLAFISSDLYPTSFKDANRLKRLYVRAAELEPAIRERESPDDHQRDSDHRDRDRAVPV